MEGKGDYCFMEEKAKGISEDWLAVWIGLFIFVVSLGAFIGADVLILYVWNSRKKVRRPPGKTTRPAEAAAS